MHLIRKGDMHRGFDGRHRCGLIAPDLWKPPAPGGIEPWEPGTEIRSDVMFLSLFNDMAAQDVHYHCKTTEFYMVLEGMLTMRIKTGQEDEWHEVLLHEGDMLLVQPGEIHVPLGTSPHLSMVIQVPPPSDGDKVIVPE